MDAKTLEALKGSIRKWELIELQGGEDDGPNNCPLCVIFRYERNCGDCPVVDMVDESECRITPYITWYHHQNTKHKVHIDKTVAITNITPHRVQCAECVRLARAEKEFLISLLPEGESWD